MQTRTRDVRHFQIFTRSEMDTSATSRMRDILSPRSTASPMISSRTILSSTPRIRRRRFTSAIQRGCESAALCLSELGGWFVVHRPTAGFLQSTIQSLALVVEICTIEMLWLAPTLWWVATDLQLLSHLAADAADDNGFHATPSVSMLDASS